MNTGEKKPTYSGTTYANDYGQLYPVVWSHKEVTSWRARCLMLSTKQVKSIISIGLPVVIRKKTMFSIYPLLQGKNTPQSPKACLKKRWFLSPIYQRCKRCPLLKSQKPEGYCWRTYFKVLGVRFIGEVFPAFLPSKKACGTHLFRHF
jgi:hypothetical protein